MAFKVLLTNDAVCDLKKLYDYIARNDTPDNAEHVFTQIEKAVASLSESPERGTYPKELLQLGLREFREIFFKPYRIIYKIVGNNVYVLLVSDGRRDMQSLLQRRLLEG